MTLLRNLQITASYTTSKNEVGKRMTIVVWFIWKMLCSQIDNSNVTERQAFKYKGWVQI